MEQDSPPRPVEAVRILPGHRLSADGQFIRIPHSRDWAVALKILDCRGRAQAIDFPSLSGIVQPPYTRLELRMLIRKCFPSPQCGSFVEQAGSVAKPYFWTDARVEEIGELDPVAKVVIAERSGFARLGMSTVLGGSPQIKIVGAAGSFSDLRAAVNDLKPDVVFTPLDLPSKGENNPYTLLRELSRTTSIALLIPSYRDSGLGMQTLFAVSRFVLAFVDSDDYQKSFDGILAAYSGRQYVSPGLLRQGRVYSIHELLKLITEASAKFTLRELEVLRFLGRGFTSLEAADQLEISKKTVESHRSNILNKASCFNKTETIHHLGVFTGLALAIGLIRPEDIGVG